jgi:hypothetical protein
MSISPPLTMYFDVLRALLIVAFVYLTPILWVLLSSRSHGGAKLGWFLVVLFFSWLGLAVFLIVTQAPGISQTLRAVIPSLKVERQRQATRRCLFGWDISIPPNH